MFRFKFKTLVSTVFMALVTTSSIWAVTVGGGLTGQRVQPVHPATRLPGNLQPRQYLTKPRIMARILQADDVATLFINGDQVAQAEYNKDGGKIEWFDITDKINFGNNSIVLDITNTQCCNIGGWLQIMENNNIVVDQGLKWGDDNRVQRGGYPYKYNAIDYIYQRLPNR